MNPNLILKILISFTLSVFTTVSCTTKLEVVSVKVPVSDIAEKEIPNIKFSGENRIIFMFIGPEDQNIIQSLRNNSFDSAIKSLEEKYQVKKDDNSLFNLAAGYYFVKDYSKAISSYNELINKKYSLAETYNNIAACYGNNSDYQKALEYYQKSIDSGKELSQVYHNIGVENKIKNKYDIAIENYTKALKINPNDANSYYNRANIYYVLGDYETAIKDYSKAIDIGPDNPGFYNNRAISESEKNNIYESSIKDYTKAIELRPNYVEAYYNRGIAYINLSLYKESIKDFDKVIQLAPEIAGAYYYRGNAYFNGMEYEKAVKDYTKLIELKSDYQKAYNNRGSAYAILKEYTKAVNDFTKLIDLSPNDGDAYTYRANAYFYLGQPEAFVLAIKDYTKVLELKNDTKVYLNRGSCYANIGKYNEAISDYSKYIEIYPGEANPYYYRALAYIEKNDKDKSAVDLKKACEMGESLACGTEEKNKEPESTIIN